MHFYWKMMEELKLIGETWIIRDPSLLRCYRQWMEKNQSALKLSETGLQKTGGPHVSYRGIPHCLN